MKGALVVFAIASIADAHLCLLSPHQRGSMQSINTQGERSAPSGEPLPSLTIRCTPYERFALVLAAQKEQGSRVVGW